MRTRIVACVLACLWISSLNASGPIALTVSPLQSFAPATLSVRVQMKPSPADRTLEIVVDSGSYYRSSRMQLDGEHAATTNSLELRSVPGGEYEIRATVTDSTGHERAAARQQVIVW